MPLALPSATEQKRVSERPELIEELLAVTNCHPLKMVAGGGKMYQTDVAELINSRTGGYP